MRRIHDTGLRPDAHRGSKARARFVAVWAGALGAIGVLIGCATVSGKEDASIYYSSQTEADAALAAFDRDNPACQLWTNWQKMCSRSGADGATICQEDAPRAVDASDPFCLWAQPPKFGKPPTSPLQQASASRFCEGDLYDSQTLSCTSPALNRPFDGRSLAARRHPYCEVWAEEHTGQPICAEGDAFPELSRCSEVADRGYRARNPLYCARPRETAEEECTSPAGWNSGRRGVSRPSYPSEIERSPRTIVAVNDPDPYVLALYCEDNE